MAVIGNGESGALSPLEAAQETYETGLHHLNGPSQLAFVKIVYGGSLLSFGGMLALTASVEASGLQESNPGIPTVLQGATFPIGLVIIYFIGAELYVLHPFWYYSPHFKYPN